MREQVLMLLIDPEAALAAIPPMLPSETEARLKALELVRSVLIAARGELSAEETERSARIERLFGGGRDSAKARRLTVLPGSEKDTLAKAVGHIKK